jgi:ABC-type phosphate transport system substrate-binding protein
MKRWLRILLAAAGLAVVTVDANAQQREAIAIVVHPSVRQDDVTFAQLRQLFMGEQQYWSDRTRVTLLMRAPRATERDIVLERIYDMSEAEFRQYWIGKIFRAEIPTGPKLVFSTDMTKELIAALPGAISFMNVSDVTAGMKVLRIDGRRPGDPGYALQ